VLDILPGPTLDLQAEVAHLVERQPSKLRVAGSSPVFCSILRDRAVVARKAHNLEVIGSSPVPATNKSVVT
jgi:hypothetical protein